MVSKKILIVDDDPDVREVTQLCLEVSRDWQIITACSGQEGIQTAIYEQPDLILLDVMMPELDGLDTWKKLKQHPKTQQIPVIFLTARVQAQEKQCYQDLGIEVVLAKPFDPLFLADAIAKALQWQ
ncbi:MAG: response regulator [Jaaginema sp. PMC 1079.18]|nr:response regulator [Jaaginema sp. PMC 1080.18]MEC4850422.1 response regulator [Jaaginema sp. PMC 1079.18]MEC4866557.1 response regulator [Jaaginema sp. PMC 1078.18]